MPDPTLLEPWQPDPQETERVTSLILESTGWPPDASLLVVSTSRGAKLVCSVPGALARVLWALGAVRARHVELGLDHATGWVRVKELPERLVELFGPAFRVEVKTAGRYLNRVAKLYDRAARRQVGSAYRPPPLLLHDHRHGVRVVCALERRGPTPACPPSGRSRGPLGNG